MTYPRAIRALFPAETGRLGYAFFRHATAQPFDFSQPDAHLWANAWWSSQLALLAYHEDKASIGPELARGGLVLAGDVVEVRGLRAFVALRDDTAFVVFRGTVLPLPDFPFNPGPYQDQIKSWFTNLDGAPAPARHGGPGKVHAGFQQALAHLEEAGLRPDLLAAGKSQLVWTGHSLGGALATLGPALMRCPDTARSTIMTCGAARAADPAFVAGLHVPHQRFVHGKDLFAATPAAALLAQAVGAYTHHGATLPPPNGWPSPDLQTTMRMIHSQIGPDDATGGPLGGLWPDLAAAILALIPAPLLDHAPLLYTAACEREMLAS